ncbi:hypothetical protein EUTSA_v10019003mg [Eutrema salsugineum]|uniref:Uncharacterized protein n=1 Tax=Eutrema salsugineum TaxID=72664 RepID=V4MC13_EUTSA|nr:uncharacterized protein LOC18008997 [Eutrema salsugineum]ESQ28751.1 hypothetical protein EUTSA_v10019003mg [Eutrema salsugineum]
MAVDLLSENSNMSPRISFSRDFCQSDAIPIEKRPLRSSNSKPSSLNSSIDFDFCIPGGVNSAESFDQGSWSADELFRNGQILPTEIKKKKKPESPPPEKRNPGQKGPDTGPTEPTKPDFRKQRKPVEEDDDVSVTEEKPNTKSFWGFKRSSSLNCGSSYGRSLCPLPLLNRSNSTGSTSSKPKQSSRKHTTEHIKLQQSSSLSSSSSSSSTSSNSSFQKPPLKKNYGGYSYGSHGGGIRVSPVINMVPSGNMFGLGSIFSGNGRDKNKKR